MLAAIDITQDIDEKTSTVKDLPCEELVLYLETYNKPKYYLLIVVCIWILVGCSNSPSPLITPESGDFSRQFQIINQDNVSSLEEVLDLPAPIEANSVIGINFNPSANKLIAVYSPSGIARVWDVQSQKILREFTTNITSSRNVSFDSSGNYLVGSMYSEFKDDDFFNKEYFGGVGVWNAVIGDIALCINATCDATKGSEEREPVFALSSPIGFSIDPKGKWALIYGMRFIKYVNLSTEEASSITYDTQIGEDLKLIGNVAFDYQGKNIAIAYQEGGVVIQKFPFYNLDIFPTTLQESQSTNLHSPVPAFSFSPNDKWLARIYQNKVTVWNVEKRQDVLINESIPSANILSFDPSSNFLYVATSNEVAALSLQNGKKIKIYNTPEITYITVSADGRLIIWGDQGGNVHFLGDPRK